uniref:Ig-like domain-containing protein n=1 Tax=Equus asinus TaxID=9793 RepID=A0A9L0J4A4_EQUAS
MGSRLLCSVMLCLLGAGDHQMPRYLIKTTGQTVTLRCSPISEHCSVSWYQHSLKQGLEFLTYFQDDLASDTSGMPNDRFSAERPEGSSSTLKIQCTERGDSVMYICASSSAIAWHRPFLPLHKPSCATSPHGSQNPEQRSCLLFPHQVEQVLWDLLFF